MPSPSDEIFLLSGENLQPLPAQTMRAGLFGKTLEDALQTILQKYPKVIPGKQIDPVSEDPPRFVLLRREMPVGNWSLDHLYVDQHGILTLVETKLIQNPESRREVIGQIIEYAANALELWGSGVARQYAGEFWGKQSVDLDEVLRAEFGGDLDIEELWGNVETNLKAGRLRLIIAADEIRPEVRRMIEYLNRETQNAEVLGLELKCYGNGESSVVLVPQLLGQTQRSIDRHTSNSDSIPWTPEKLKAAYNEMEDSILSKALQYVLDWSVDNRVFMEARAKLPVFGIRGPINMRIISFFSNGGIYLFFDKKNWGDNLDKRDELINQMKLTNFINADINSDNIISGRTLNVKLTELAYKDIDLFILAVSKYSNVNHFNIIKPNKGATH